MHLHTTVPARPTPHQRVALSLIPIAGHLHLHAQRAGGPPVTVPLTGPHPAPRLYAALQRAGWSREDRRLILTHLAPPAAPDVTLTDHAGRTYLTFTAPGRTVEIRAGQRTTLRTAERALRTWPLTPAARDALLARAAHLNASLTRPARQPERRLPATARLSVIAARL